MLKGKVALITGASQGIGRACASIFAEKGAKLVLIDRQGEGLKELSRDLLSKGHEVISFKFDLIRTGRIESLVSNVRKKTSVDILVNNAGFDRPGTLQKTDPKGFLEVLTIHVLVPFILIKLLSPDMVSKRWGRIINISSVYGITGAKGELAYSTAKAAIIGLTKSAARELGPYGVTVNAIAPGIISTPPILRMPEKYKDMILSQTPLGRMGEPEEVAKVAAFLASDDASYITGATILVSGGYAI